MFAAACIAVALACGSIFFEAHRYTSFPVDAYYYMDMAQRLMRHGTLSVRFEQGVPVHFFPGYPILLGALSLGFPSNLWPDVQAILIIAIAVMFGRILVRGGMSLAASCASVALLASNPILLKWAAVPYSELAAIMWSLAAITVFPIAMDGSLRAGRWRWFASGLFTGMAILTRPETAMLVVALPAFGIFFGRKTQPSELAPAEFRAPRVPIFPLLTYLLLSFLPVGVYMMFNLLSKQPALAYAGELQNEAPGFSRAFGMFMVQLNKLFHQPNVSHPNNAVNLVSILEQFVFEVTLLVALRGYAGRRTCFGAWMFLAYLAAHSLWYYSSERFNVLAIPLATALLVRGIEWLVTRQPGITLARKGGTEIFGGLVLILCTVHFLMSRPIIADHQFALEQNEGRPEQLAQIANEAPGIAWTETGPPFAYVFKGRTYFDSDNPYFYRRTVTDPGAYFKQNHVTWIVSRRTSEEWLTEHSAVKDLGIMLQRVASDGKFVLYRLGYP